MREIQSHGFDPARIGTLAGASGGAKWLVLSQLDRVVAGELLPAMRGPVHTIGTSIGAWRFACYGQADPVAAIDRFEQAYLDQTYSEKPDRAEITANTREILDFVLGDTGVDEILGNHLLRTHVITVRSRGLSASEKALPLTIGLLSAAGLNAVNRSTLGLSFDRVLFYDEREQPPFYELNGFPMFRVPMSKENYKDAVLASGAIPWFSRGVRDIAGAPPGMYRDGGVIDYHLDFPHSADDRLALYLHFYEYLKPGWFDKRLSRTLCQRGQRRSDPARESIARICRAPCRMARSPIATILRSWNRRKESGSGEALSMPASNSLTNSGKVIEKELLPERVRPYGDF